MKDHPISLRFRSDLKRQRLAMGNRFFWVLKDPLTKEFHHVNDDEYTILTQLDGNRSMNELLRECSQLFPSKVLAPEGLIRFIADASRRGLVLGGSDLESKSVTSLESASPLPSLPRLPNRSPRMHWWQNCLAIRFPGVRPDRFLHHLDSLVGPVFNKTSAWLFSMVMFISLMIATIHWGTLRDQVSIAFQNRGTHTVVQLFVVVSAVKILHELAHAIACRKFGGECRELGAMLLLGVPCLYCDVSDAWMMPQRHHRMIVSAAGMMAELALAALALFLWLITGDTVVGEWCLVVMMVCSVSTVLVNGNPLMRYDGYFILSDLVGIPNLASKASLSLRQLMRKFLWQEPVPTANDRDRAPSFWLATFAVASLLYRVLVMVAVVGVIYRFSDGHGIATIGAAACALLAIATLAPEVRPLLAPPPFHFRGTRRTHRFGYFQAMGSAALIAVFLIPIPRTIVAPMTIEANGSQAVYATAGGKIQPHVNEGDRVRRGDVIATLQNETLRSEYLEAETRLAILATQYKTLLGRRQSQPGISALLLSTAKAEDAARDRFRLLAIELDRLTVKANVDGMIIHPAYRFDDPIDGIERWSGTPLDISQSGTWLDPGTTICFIGDPQMREARLLVDQRDVSLVRIGQTADLLLSDFGKSVWEGQVIEVGASPTIDFPPELIETGMVAMEGTSNPRSSPASPRDTYYQVRVSLSDSKHPLPIRTTGYARIRVDSASLLTRWIRTLRQSFRL